MKTSLLLPVAAAGLIALAGCAKHDSENVTVNDTTTNVTATDLNASDLNATDATGANAADANAAAVDTGSNAGDAATNG